ncbi:MAG: twin-arginine translocase subunit TatC [Gaiellales bacterium]
MPRRPRRVRPDEELSLVEHLDELRTRLIVSLAALVVAVALCWWKYGAIYHLLTSPIHHRKLYAFSPTEAFFNTLSVSIYSALLITLPIISYQIYAFVIPAFSERHHRSLRPLLLMVPGLFVCGVVFGWYLVVPAAIRFLTGFNSEAIQYLPRASDYIRFVMLTLIAMGIVFELPVVMLVLGRLGIVRSASMRRRWREWVVGLAVFAAILPGVDPVTMMAEYIPILLLFGLSYFLVRAVEPKGSRWEWGDEDGREDTVT